MANERHGLRGKNSQTVEKPLFSILENRGFRQSKNEGGAPPSFADFIRCAYRSL